MNQDLKSFADHLDEQYGKTGSRERDEFDADMKRFNLIAKCRYYQGEKDCPEHIVKAEKGYIWYYESIWVEWEGIIDDRGEYDGYGLSDFELNDGVPLSLKKLLFNRFIHGQGSVKYLTEPFKKWYVEKYKGESLQ